MQWSLTGSREVPEVSTPYRRIRPRFLLRETVPILREAAPDRAPGHLSQPPILWHRAEASPSTIGQGTSGLTSLRASLANAGYKREKMHEAMLSQLETGVWHTFLLPTSPGPASSEKLERWRRPALTLSFSHHRLESTEHALKLMRTFGRESRGAKEDRDRLL